MGKKRAPAAALSPDPAPKAAKANATPKKTATLKTTLQTTTSSTGQEFYKLWASPSKNPRAFPMLAGKSLAWNNDDPKKLMLEPAKNGQLPYLCSGGGYEVRCLC